MPLIGNNNEPVKEVGLFAYDGSLWRPVKIDASGNLQIEFATGQTIEVTQDNASLLLATVDIATGQTIEVTQDVAANLLATVTVSNEISAEVKNYGYISSNWQKSPIPFGASDSISEGLSNTNLSAGANFLSGTTTPSGQINVITNSAFVYIGTSPSSVEIQALVNSQPVQMLVIASPTSGRYYPLVHNTILFPGDYMRCQINGATATDDAYFRYCGYIIDTDL